MIDDWCRLGIFKERPPLGVEERRTELELEMLELKALKKQKRRKGCTAVWLRINAGWIKRTVVST